MPGRMGRPSIWGPNEPVVRTYVSIPAKDWSWVKEKGLNFSSLLARKIHELRKADEQAEADAVVKEFIQKREAKAGVTDAGPESV